jgi:hypothetical protein
MSAYNQNSSDDEKDVDETGDYRADDMEEERIRWIDARTNAEMPRIFTCRTTLSTFSIHLALALSITQIYYGTEINVPLRLSGKSRRGKVLCGFATILLYTHSRPRKLPIIRV